MSAPTYIQAFMEAYGLLAANTPAVPQQLWIDQIPEQESATYPRAEFSMIGDQPVFDQSGEMMRTARSRLSVFATSALQVEELIGEGGTIREYFGNPQVLSITNKQNRLWPGSYTPAILSERTKQGQPIYVGSLEHQCELF